MIAACTKHNDCIFIYWFYSPMIFALENFAHATNYGKKREHIAQELKLASSSTNIMENVPLIYIVAAFV